MHDLAAHCLPSRKITESLAASQHDKFEVIDKFHYKGDHSPLLASLASIQDVTQRVRVMNFDPGTLVPLHTLSLILKFYFLNKYWYSCYRSSVWH